MPVAEKREFAHFEIDSSGSPEDTDRAADALAATLAALAGGGRGRGGAPLERLLGGLVHGPEAARAASRRRSCCGGRGRGGAGDGGARRRRLEPPAAGPGTRRRGRRHRTRPRPPGRGARRLGASAAGAPTRTFLAAAAASVARLTHTDPARAPMRALSRSSRSSGPSRPADRDVRGARGPAAARRPLRGRRALGRLDAFGRPSSASRATPAQARADCARLGGDGPTAAALAGLGARSRRRGAPGARARGDPPRRCPPARSAEPGWRLVDVERGVCEPQLEEVRGEEAPAGNRAGRGEHEARSILDWTASATTSSRAPGRPRAAPRRWRPGPAAATGAPAARPARARARAPAPLATRARSRGRSRSRPDLAEGREQERGIVRGDDRVPAGVGAQPARARP